MNIFLKLLQHYINKSASKGKEVGLLLKISPSTFEPQKFSRFRYKIDESLYFLGILETKESAAIHKAKNKQIQKPVQQKVCCATSDMTKKIYHPNDIKERNKRKKKKRIE